MRLLWGGLVLFDLFFSFDATAAAARIGMNFPGVAFGSDSAAFPPDTTGAAGLFHYVEFVNGQFAVFDKTTGQRVKSVSDLQFWANAGVTLSSQLEVSDPRLVFDAGSGRWFAVMIDVDTVSMGANRFLLAVSATDDPTGIWRGIAFAADPVGSSFADFPTLGVDAFGIYLSGDLFDSAGNETGAITVSIPKPSLLANPPTTAGLTRSATLSHSARGWILQPAVVTGTPSTPELFVAVSDLGLDFRAHSGLQLSAVQTGTLALDGVTTVPTPSYSVPINPVQPDGSTTLDDGDARISSVSRRVGDILYAVHGTEVSGRAAIQWFKIDAVAKTMIESGIITNATLDLFYPSIAANETGQVVIGCNGSSASTFVSAYAFVGDIAAGHLKFTGPMLLKSGLASYRVHSDTGTDRWGDYSATVVDPSDRNQFWTIQMFPLNAATWATQITQIILGAPILTLTTTATGLKISWPDTTGVQLQSTTDLSANSWQTVTPAPISSGGFTSVTVPFAGEAAFFRLVSL
jgi:hypothetical protein